MVRLIKAAAENREEMIQLVKLAEKRSSLFYELDEDDVVEYLRSELRTEGKRSNLPRVECAVVLD